MRKFGELYSLDARALDHILLCKENEAGSMNTHTSNPCYSPASKPTNKESTISSEAPSTDSTMDQQSGKDFDCFDSSSEISDTISSSFSYSSGSSESAYNTERSSTSSDSNEETAWNAPGTAFLVPGLLSETSPEAFDMWAEFGTNEDFGEIREYLRSYHFAYLPIQLFPRLLVALLHYCVPQTIWRTGFFGTCAGE